MTPREAIAIECRFCMNTERLRKCESKICHLNETSSTALRRIKAHCLACTPDRNRQGVEACTGKIISPRIRMCSLYPYRLGHNPNRAGLGFGCKGHTQGTVTEAKGALNIPVGV